MRIRDDDVTPLLVRYAQGTAVPGTSTRETPATADGLPSPADSVGERLTSSAAPVSSLAPLSLPAAPLPATPSAQLSAPSPPTPPGAPVSARLLKACAKMNGRAQVFADAMASLSLSPADQAQLEDRLCGLVKSSYSDRHVLDALAFAGTTPQPLREFSGYARLVDLSNASQGLTDFKVACDEAVARHGPVEIAIELMVALRKADPGRRREFAFFESLAAPLAYLLDAPSPDDQTRRVDLLARLREGKRLNTEALCFATALDGLTCDACQRRQVESQLLPMLRTHASRADADLVGALTASNGPDASARFRAFAGLLSEVQSSRQALADFELCAALAATHGVPLSEVTDHVLAIREAEPSRKSDYRSFSALQAPLDHVLSQSDGAEQSRCRERLVALQCGRSHAVEAVLPVEKALQGLKVPESERDEVRASVTRLLGILPDWDLPGLIEGLALVDGKPDATARLAVLEHLVDLDGRRISAAVTDLCLADDAAARHGLPFADVARRLIALRTNDPGRKAAYPRLANLSAPLEQVVAQGGDEAHDLLIRLQVGRRTPSDALEHDRRLRAIGGDEAAQAKVRAEYQALLRKCEATGDPHLLGLLDTLATCADPLEGLRGYRRILAATGNVAAALTDFHDALAAASASGVSVDEMVDHVETLRKADPRCHADYPTFAPLAEALEIIGERDDASAAPHASLRHGRRQQICDFMRKGRGMNQALPHVQAFRALVIPVDQREAVGRVYRELMDREGDDKVLLGLLGLVDGHDDALARFEEMRSLGKAARGHLQVVLADYPVLADLAARKSSISRAEIVEHAVRMRDGDPRRRDGYFSAIEPALSTILEGVTPDERTARRTAYMRLLERCHEATTARSELDWMLSTADAGDDLATRTRTMTRLGKRVPDYQHASMQALYERIQAAAAQQPQGWVGRLLRLPRTFERIAHDLLERQKDARSVATLLDALEGGRFEQESYRTAYRRLQDVLNLGKLGQADVASVAEAFGGVTTGGQVLGATPEQRWERFEGLLRKYQSASAASLVWRAMTSAGTADEASARQAAFERLCERYSKRPDDALRVYRAITDDLSATDSVVACLGVVEDLAMHQTADMVAASYRAMRTMRDLPDDQKQTVAWVFSRARSGAEVEQLVRIVSMSVSNESVPERASVLQALLASGLSVPRTVEAFSILRGVVGDGHFSTVAPALATVAGVLQRAGEGEGVLRACDALAWARGQQFEADSDLTLPQALTELASHLLLTPDLEAAKKAVLETRSERRRARLGAGPVKRVEMGDEEVSIGGVRIKVRRPDPPDEAGRD